MSGSLRRQEGWVGWRTRTGVNIRWGKRMGRKASRSHSVVQLEGFLVTLLSGK